MISWETTEPEYILALEWSEAADGSPICYDDGVAYDSIRATLTGRLLPDELETLQTAWTTTRGYDITSTGYLLGPEIDMSVGAHVALLDVVVDGPTDSSMNLYDVTIVVAFGPLDAPAAGDISKALSGGVPYHSAYPTTLAYLLCDGDEYSVTAGRAVDRECRWYASGLSTQDAREAVQALRTLRGSQYAWYPTGIVEPWGPGVDPIAMIWIPSWQVVAESNLTWGIEMQLIRDTGTIPDPYFVMIGDDADMAGDDGSEMIGVL